QPLALVLRRPSPPRLCSRRDAARGSAGSGRSARTGGGATAARALPARRRDDRLRQGLRGPRVRRGGRRTRRQNPAAGAPRRTPARPAPGNDPAAIESVFFTCKDLLSLERHGARTLRNLCVRIYLRLLALTACISLNHQLGRPSRALVDY